MPITIADIDSAEPKLIGHLRRGVRLESAATIAGLDPTEVKEALRTFEQQRGKGGNTTRIGARLHRIISQAKAEGEAHLVSILAKSATGYGIPDRVETKCAVTGKKLTIRVQPQYIPPDNSAAKYLLGVIAPDAYGPKAGSAVDVTVNNTTNVDVDVAAQAVDDLIDGLFDEDDE